VRVAAGSELNIIHVATAVEALEVREEGPDRKVIAKARVMSPR
jgi:hypothetical protein